MGSSSAARSGGDSHERARIGRRRGGALAPTPLGGHFAVVANGHGSTHLLLRPMRFLKTEACAGAPYLAGAPLLIAHRGGAGLAPENTLTAFGQALDWWGADILELDVHPTRDGEAVVLHDARVDRTSDGKGAASELSLAQIRQLDAGYRYSPDGGASYPYRGEGIRIPTLEEVLLAYPGRRINIEVKDHRAGPRVREVIQAAGAESRILIAAEQLKARRSAGIPAVASSASGPELRTFYLLHRLGAPPVWRPPVDALQLPYRHRSKEVVNAALIRDAHRYNLAVHVWTVDAEDEMRRLLAGGVDGIVTDRPDRLGRVLHERVGRPLAPGPPEAERQGFLERLLLA